MWQKVRFVRANDRRTVTSGECVGGFSIDIGKSPQQHTHTHRLHQKEERSSAAEIRKLEKPIQAAI